MLRRLHMMRSGQQGLVALEFLIVMTAWLMALAFLADMSLMLGDGVAMQAAVNRAALQASAQGCLTPESGASVQGIRGLLAKNININAVWVPSSAPNDPSQAVPFNRAQAVAYMNNGNPSSHNAACPLAANASATDVVPQDAYILVQLDYDQKIFLFPAIHVTKTALAVSGSLNLEGNQ